MASLLDKILGSIRLPSPLALPYDVSEWQKAPFAERNRMVCQAWAVQGYGAPLTIYGLYLLKILGFVGVWAFFCVFPVEAYDWGAVASWGFAPVAFQKAILWSMLYEGLGLGCGSGPLTGRYVPPVAGFVHFLWPGTTKVPLFSWVPVLGRARRTWFDAALYLAHCVFLFRALMAPEITPELLIPTAILLPILGLSDKTIFLASRGEHYYTTLICFLFMEDWIAGAMAVQVAIWMWAAVSKMTRHFPAVICVMTSNHPLMRIEALRKAVYRDFPDDLRPARIAGVMAHMGTVVELGFPLLLIFGDGGAVTIVGLVVMVGFHAYITSNFPMGVPIEWNVVVVYGAFFLFWFQRETSLWEISSPVLAAFLVVMLVVVPLVGNLAPRWVSFLLSMRYYAGNWAYSVWLFKGESAGKLDEHLTKVTPSVHTQLGHFYDEETIVGLLSKVLAFRTMHLHGRALHTLLPMAVDDVDEYEYFDGELIAGMVLGWNFGDGHLHDERLLSAVQAQCGFEPGELRCIFVESQPLGGSTLAWRIVDACEGAVSNGELEVAGLLEEQPWPTAQ